MAEVHTVPWTCLKDTPYVKHCKRNTPTSYVCVVQIFPNWTTPEWPGFSQAGEGLPAYYLSMKDKTGYDASLQAQFARK